MACDMQHVYKYINSLLSKPPTDKKGKQKSEVRHFERKTKCAYAYAYDVTAFPESSFIAVLHTDTEYLVSVEFGKEGFKALRQNDEGSNYGLMIVVLDGNTVKIIGDAIEFTIPEESGKPCCIAVKDSELIAISFPDNGTISLYDKQGQFKHELNAHLMCGVFTTSKDRFIYTTPKTLVSISDTGENIFSEETSSTPRSICCDNYGNIYVTVVKTDETSCGVDCFTRYGTYMGCVVENYGDPYDDITLMLTPSRDLLVAAKKSIRTYEVPLPCGMFKCSDGKCITCKEHVKESPTFTICYVTKEQRPILSHISCTTRNIIYLITCKKCDFHFVGHTKKHPLEKQIANHRTSVANAKKYKTRRLIIHYKQEGHEMMLQGIESLDGRVGLRRREKFWIETLQTIDHGLNMILPNATERGMRKITPDAGMFKCNENRCITCEFVTNSTTFTRSLPINDDAPYEIKSRITCTTKNIIYLITCKECNIQYVGQTQRKLKERFGEHRSSVNTAATVTHHFSGDHSVHDMVVQGIESLDENPKPTLIKEKKEYWNNELETKRTVALFNTLICDATLLI
ncbi:uncharacterized protein [Asterias amurensis]|uniref:uncharacterized protein n=1 Tax=Asterias amurensis TaxID=7602 RepID=UPI003AB6F6C1